MEDILNLEVKSNPDWSSDEKETTVVMDNERVLVYSSQRTGVRWAVERIKEGHAKLIDYTIVDDCLCAIKIECGFNLITLKSKPRSQNNVSNCFSV